MTPSVDLDSRPTRSEDGTGIEFPRRPGLAFVQSVAARNQRAQGRGIGVGSDSFPGTPGEGGCAGQGQAAGAQQRVASGPGFQQATLPGGHTLAIMVADVAAGEAGAERRPQRLG